MFCASYTNFYIANGAIIMPAYGIAADQDAAEHPTLRVAGLVGSIDNDLVGTDMTIGADSALHRIVDAIDDLASTAASHQRSFVVDSLAPSVADRTGRIIVTEFAA